MPEGALLLAFVTLQRLAELALAARNTRRLIAQGAVEFGQRHYPLMVLFHAAWLVSLWWLGASEPVRAGFLAVFVLLQGVRLWVLASLGSRWTTRIIVVPSARLVRRGPYRYLRHPNYVVVALEVAVVPLALGLPWIAAVFSIANIPLLLHRMAVEGAALEWAQRQPAAKPTTPEIVTRGSG
jgi:methyltransferase